MNIAATLKKLPIDLGQANQRGSTMGKRIALNLVPDGKGLRALDVGCREGLQSEWLKERGYDVTAIDIEKCYNDCIVMDVNNGLLFPDNSFALVWCSEVIEHLESPSFFVREVQRVLHPGGKLILTTPNSGFWLYPLARLFGKSAADLQNPTHRHFFTEHDIRSLFPDGHVYGFFPYFLLKFRIQRFLGPLSPTFVVEMPCPAE